MGKLLFSIELDDKNLYRRDFVLGKLSKYVNLPKSDVLEVGIGNGKFGKLLGQKVKHYWGIDIDAEYVKIARTNIPEGAKVSYRVGNALDIPYKKKFDVVFYANSWHFIKDFDKALQEAVRVLKPRGIVVILEPSENTTSWADPRLRKDSPEFDPKMYERKQASLRVGRDAILGQKAFEVVEDEYEERMKANWYILKRRD